MNPYRRAEEGGYLANYIVGIAATVIGGLLLAAITGNIVMYRQVGQLEIAVTELSRSLNVLLASTEKQSERDRVDKETLVIWQRAIAARLTRIDRKVE